MVGAAFGVQAGAEVGLAAGMAACPVVAGIGAVLVVAGMAVRRPVAGAVAAVGMAAHQAGMVVVLVVDMAEADTGNNLPQDKNA